MSSNSATANQCEYCGERYVVNSLARLCEKKHEGLVVPRAIDIYNASLDFKDQKNGTEEPSLE